MNEHRYTLEPYNGMKTRYHCPNCNKKGVFTKYIDLQTNEYLNDAVGKCNRLIKCGYHYAPKDYFTDNNISFDAMINHNVRTWVKPKPKPKTNFMDNEIMRKSKTSNYPNYFIDFLTNHWSKEVALELANKFHIGTSKYWRGATIFWQVDKNQNIRSGKIIQYCNKTGKRVKSNFPPVQWVHKALKLEDFTLNQCYFGEHLLNKYKSKPVAIVESEKTAVISSVYLPEFIWLASGGATNLNEAKTKVLKGRDVVLFPDLNCYDLWKKKIPELTKLASFRISTLLEDKATEKEKELGLDIADYLLNLSIDFNDL